MMQRCYLPADADGCGFLTFMHVDLHGRPLPHGMVIDAVGPDEIRLQEMAKALHPAAPPQGGSDPPSEIPILLKKLRNYLGPPTLKRPSIRPIIFLTTALQDYIDHRLCPQSGVEGTVKFYH